MRKRVNVFLLCSLAAALPGAGSLTARADESEGAGTVEVEQETPRAVQLEQEAPPGPQEPENRWVPSLAIVAGANFQKLNGFAESYILPGMNPPEQALQPQCIPALNPTCAPVPVKDDDLVIAPFVGASLEILTPALPVPTRPRFFAAGEILPSFASDYEVALEGDPTCVKGPEADAPCATEEPPGARSLPFSESQAKGQGIRTTATMDTLMFGANAGVAFPVQFGERRLRIKPSVAWLQYKVDAEGRVVDAECSPPNRCTNTYGTTPPLIGFLREPESLSAKDSKRFNGIGPGIDVEVDTGRFGPIGTSLFLGARFYHILGNRKISFSVTQDYNDAVGNDTEGARFEVEVDPWMYRAQVGFRLHWLGGP